MTTKNMTNTAVTWFEELLPQSGRRRLKLYALKGGEPEVYARRVASVILVKDQIADHFKTAARSETKVRRFKRANGYCGGYIACLQFVGMEQSLCGDCSRAAAACAQRARTGAPRLNRQSEYGQMRAKERKMAREEKERLGSRPRLLGP